MIGRGAHRQGPFAESVGLVRVGEARDAAAAAKLHSSEISSGFLSALGPSFLRRLYARIAACEGSFLLVAECSGETVGFLGGSVDVSRLYRTFLRRDAVLAAAGAPLELLRSWRRAFETLGHRREAVASEAELLAVAVDPRWRGRGFGHMLVERFVEETLSRGATSATVVVGSENRAAISLYRAAGFEIERSYELHRGASSSVMRRDDAEISQRGER